MEESSHERGARPEALPAASRARTKTVRRREARAKRAQLDRLELQELKKPRLQPAAGDISSGRDMKKEGGTKEREEGKENHRKKRKASISPTEIPAPRGVPPRAANVAEGGGGGVAVS